MKNGERFKTADERYDAFHDTFTTECHDCKYEKVCSGSYAECAFRWLEMEVKEEKPLPCMCCGGRMEIHGQALACTKCGLRISYGLTTNEVINVYNRAARAMAGRNETK